MATTTPDAAITTIERTLRLAFPTIAILFPNVPFTPPTSAPWLKCWVLWGKSMNMTMRPTLSQHDLGIIHIDVCVPQGQGAGAQRRLGEQIRAAYQGRTLAGVRCEAASGLIFPREETWLSGAYWCASVRIPFLIIEEVPL